MQPKVPSWWFILGSDIPCILVLAPAALDPSISFLTLTIVFLVLIFVLFSAISIMKYNYFKRWIDRD